jgi:two-component system cell cycle sensor histidine kinase PleC
MTPNRSADLYRLGWVLAAVSVYFALLWFLLASEHRHSGSLVVLGVGLLLGTFSVRTLALLRGKPGHLGDAARTKDAGSVQDTIDTHSAQPEPPALQRARFVGALGHELRNPLNSVTGFSDMLLGRIDGDLNAEQERSVRTIRSSAERLLRLVSTVVDQAKLEAGTLRLQSQWVSPRELVSEAMDFARSRADTISLSGDVSEGLPRVFVDRHRTVQALVGLTVLVIRSSETDVAIRVAPPRRDQTGKGFVQFDLIACLEDSKTDTLAIVERLERPSSRLDALGLEVAVARSVIEAQGGRIWTEAGTGGGLRICVTLPTSAP